MVETWSTRAGLYAIFAAAALIAAGCSHVATAPEEQDPEQLDEETVETVELDPAISKLDEAEIGVSGPEQIEEAIETLDAQTESRPPLVSGVSGTAAAPSAGDLFERIRAGFVLDDVEHAAVEREVRWFASHPEYLDRTFKRGERYCTTSSTRSKRARCRSSSHCCRSSRARSIRSRIRGRALRACGNSFPAPAAATA